jgi:ABC-type multidrug transport system fused ATPase/permease subunit
LQDGLEKATEQMTVVAIAHRLYTIRKADVCGPWHACAACAEK